MPNPVAQQSLPTRLLADLQGIAEEVDLTAQTGATANVQSVVTQMVPERLALGALPAVVLTYFGETEEETPRGAFGRHFTTYLVSCMIVDSMRMQYQQAEPDYDRWRHDLRQKFHGLIQSRDSRTLLPFTPECWQVRLKNKPAYPRDKIGKDMLLVDEFSLYVKVAEMLVRTQGT